MSERLGVTDERRERGRERGGKEEERWFSIFVM